MDQQLKLAFLNEIVKNVIPAFKVVIEGTRFLHNEDNHSFVVRYKNYIIASIWFVNPQIDVREPDVDIQIGINYTGCCDIDKYNLNNTKQYNKFIQQLKEIGQMAISIL